MDIGLLTAPFRNESLEDVVAWASGHGFDALEVNSAPGGQLDPTEVEADGGEGVKALLGAHKGIRISSLAVYSNVVDSDADKRAEAVERVKSAVRAAKLIDVEVVCTLAGMPLPGKTKMQTIEQDAAPVFQAICELAGEQGIKIALENWFQTNIQHLDHWRRLFEVVPLDNFGLNFDPSHLYWQQIDHIAAVHEFGPRIFHTHAKDCEIRRDLRASIGVLEGGWWRYVIPGFGEIHWGQYTGALRDAGFDGVLSIEHEDRAMDREHGFIKGREHLAQFV